MLIKLIDELAFVGQIVLVLAMLSSHPLTAGLACKYIGLGIMLSFLLGYLKGLISHFRNNIGDPSIQ